MPRINDELLAAQFENVSSDPSTVQVNGRIVWNTTEKKAKIYDGENWVTMGSGAGAQVTSPLAAEKFDCTTTSRTVCLSQKKCITVTAANSWLDIDDGGGEVNIQVISSDATYLLYDLNISEDAYDFCKIIEDALNNAALTYSDYVVTYSQTTRKINITHTAAGNFSILHKTGVHGTDNDSTGLGLAIGFVVTADDSGAKTYTADNPIDGSANTSLFEKTFASQTDSAYVVKSRNYRGLVETTTEKMNPTTIKWDFEADFSGLDDGEKYYTSSSGITITTGTNDAIDFDEGGGELNATLTAGTYYRGSDSDIGYRTLCAEIKTQLEAVGALTYTVTFDKNTNKFTCAGSSSYKFLWGTGTNAATDCNSELGFDASDTSLTTSQTSDNTVLNVGNIVKSSNATENSVYVGHGLPDSKMLIAREGAESSYDPIYSAPGDFLNTPNKLDHGEEIVMIDQHENSSGQGIRLYAESKANGDYEFQYKTGSGMPWISSSTGTFAVNSNGVAGQLNEDLSGNYYLLSRVFMDESGHGVAAIQRYHSGNGVWEVWTYYSTDAGDNWTVGNGAAVLEGAAGNGYHIGGIYARADKAVILTNRDDDGVSKLHISNYSGGYSVWNSIAITNDFIYNVSSSLILIQSYPSAGGDATHRIVCIGQKNADSDLYVQHFDAAGANEGSVKPFGADNRILYSACLDSDGSGNTILLSAYQGAVLDIALSNDSDSSLTFSDKGDANNGGSNIDLYNGYSGANNIRNILNNSKRCVLYGNYAYAIAQTDANGGGKKELGLFYSKDFGASWETKVDIGQSQNNQECCMQYIPSIHSFLVAYKYLATAAAGANFLLNGQIFARLIEITGDGDISLHDAEQIDGGEAEADNQGMLTMSASADCASISWEWYDGAAYDDLWDNYFI